MARLKARTFPHLSKFAVVSGLALSLWSSGCTGKPAPGPSGSASPAAVATSATPANFDTLSFEQVSELYEAPVAEGDNGWPLVRPLLVAANSETPPVFDRLQALDLSQAADLAYFDKDVLPTLKSAMSKPSFLENHPLLSGRDPLMMQYRSLRTLCELVGQRADLFWSAGERDKALELVGLPLSLAKAMQSRPETVSVNLFSQGYATTSLSLLADWAADGSLVEPQLTQTRTLLAENRPSYRHLRDCMAVDFAQLENSINDEGTRTEVLGLGMAKPEELTRWVEQIRGLQDDAQAMYGFQPVDPAKFNDEVMKQSPQVHGLVLDYPPTVEAQKRSYASFLATELAVALEQIRVAKSPAPDVDKLLADTFGEDEEAVKAAHAFLQLDYKPGQPLKTFIIGGRPEAFQLTAPEAPPFYQR